MNDDMVGRKDQRQQICYCEKKSVIQLGLRGLPGLNITFDVGVIFFLLYVLLSAESLKTKVSFIGILTVFTFSFPIYEYFSTKKR